MVKCLKFFFWSAILMAISGNAASKGMPGIEKGSLYLMENKGQIKDQNNEARKDIQFSVQSKGLSIFVSSGKLHYQFYADNPNGGIPLNAINKNNSVDYFFKGTNENQTPTFEIATYRLDVELSGADFNVQPITEEAQAYNEHFYLPGCGEGGAKAMAFKRVVYKNIYPGIDWVLMIKDNHLEYEFAIGPTGDASDIKIKYSGQTSLQKNEDGSITAVTPMGIVKERAPLSYRAQGHLKNKSGEKIASSFELKDNILSFNLDKHSGIVIDPVLEWATYYGDNSSYSPFFSIATDSFAHIYACGFTWCTTAGEIATTGSFQDTIGGNSDAFLVKFDSSGNRMWATYYGGLRNDLGNAVACDRFGNVYLGGPTNSDSGIATPGTQEPAYIWITQNASFLVKFDSSGARQWATYVGGTNGPYFDIEIFSVSCDTFGHVYAAGSTDDTANIGTPGTFKPYKTEGGADTSIDCYLIQYDLNTGLRNWGTYYGNLHHNFLGSCCVYSSNVYIFGNTECQIDSLIATPASHQPLFGGGNTDDFLVKFDSTGNRIWATYYGGNDNENPGGVICDSAGNVFIFGTTESDTLISTAGTYQPLRSGVYDGFLAKFDSAGVRQWGTYYGGPGEESSNNGCILVTGNYVYITGGTASDSGIAFNCPWQLNFGGGSEDAYLAQFYTNSGMLNWSTYYGGNSMDEGWEVVYDGKSFYLCGRTTSTNNIATMGSFLDSGGGGQQQGFLAKFDFSKPGLEPISGPIEVCKGDTIFLNDPTTGGKWKGGSGIAVVDSLTGRVIGTTAGTAIITYMISNVCFATYTDTVKKCATLVPVFTNNKATELFPNPAFDELNIKTDPGSYGSFSISNDLGQLMMEGKISSTLTKASIGFLPTGVYYIALKGNSEPEILKFEKK